MTAEVTHTEHLHTAREEQARMIALEAARKQAAEEVRKAAELANRLSKEYAKDEQQRHAANQRANRILLDFVAAIQQLRPTREDYEFGSQLDAIIGRAIEDMAAYFHDHIRDHYDARTDK
jgi:seryl-tRNA synthetase